MMRRAAVLLLATAALGLAPSVAQAKWHAAVPLPPHWPTIHHNAACPDDPDPDGVSACTLFGDEEGCDDPVGCIWLGTGPSDRYTRLHELGHIFDWQVLTDRDRERFTRMLGLQGPWFQWDGDQPNDRSPDEWFADAYAHCALRLDGRLHHGIYRSQIGYFEPGPHQYDRLCAAIRFVAIL